MMNLVIVRELWKPLETKHDMFLRMVLCNRVYNLRREFRSGMPANNLIEVNKCLKLFQIALQTAKLG